MQNKYTLVFKFPLWSRVDIDCEKLASAVQGMMRDWDEGRYPFDSEMVSIGAQRCLDAGAARAQITTDKPWILQEPEVSITEK